MVLVVAQLACLHTEPLTGSHLDLRGRTLQLELAAAQRGVERRARHLGGRELLARRPEVAAQRRDRRARLGRRAGRRHAAALDAQVRRREVGLQRAQLVAARREPRVQLARLRAQRRRLALEVPLAALAAPQVAAQAVACGARCVRLGARARQLDREAARARQLLAVELAQRLALLLGRGARRLVALGGA